MTFVRLNVPQLHAQKKEVIDTDALLQRYKKEIEELKQRLTEREAGAPTRNRRLSAREVSRRGDILQAMRCGVT